MADDFLKNIIVVASPADIPAGINHEEFFDSISRQCDLAIFLQFGDNKYNLSTSYAPAHNVRLLTYDYESIDTCVEKIAGYLESYGVQVFSRHKKRDESPLPFVLTGSIVSLPAGVALRVFEKSTDPHEIDTQKISVECIQGEWEL